MYCTQCGNNVPDGATSCNVCGSPIVWEAYQQNQYQQPQQPYQTNQYQQPQQPYQPNQYQQQQPYQPNQYQQPQQTYQSNQYQQPQQNTGSGLGMKWFKFVIYFQLYANCVLNIYNGYRLSVGKQYNLSDSNLGTLYSMFDGLQTIDIGVGISMMLLGVYAIVTKFFMAGFKKHAPFMYYLCLFFNALVAAIYCILVKATVPGLELNITRMILNAVMMAVLLICNMVYFGKRRHLFIN
ncbi:MAG: zinc-ribbon domain-containing protein [Clostridium sp.]|nr:zinc-ribbon domain-containing protein [Clostridium sp.]MCM1459316.1 zinc-ribbon domain-containing protein [Bacteroides sp.]